MDYTSKKMSKLDELFGIDFRSLALFRICIALLIICDLIIRAQDLELHYTDYGVYPRKEIINEFFRTGFFCFHIYGGTMLYQAIIFSIAIIFALFLLIGFHTRIAIFVSWLLLISVQNANQLLFVGGDLFFRVLLFWSIFLPLGATYSVDNALKVSTDKDKAYITSPASVAILMQFFFLYFFNFYYKTGDEWRTDYTAIYYALSIDELAHPLGLKLLHYKELLKYFTMFTIHFELIAPFLLFCPIKTYIVRTLTIFGFFGFQLGIGSCLQLGIFPWAATIGVLPFFPSWFWNKLTTKLNPLSISNLSLYYKHNDELTKKGLYLLNEFLMLTKVQILTVDKDDKWIQDSGYSWFLKDDNGSAAYGDKAIDKLFNNSLLVNKINPFIKKMISYLVTYIYRIFAYFTWLRITINNYFHFRHHRVKPFIVESIICTLFFVIIVLWNLTDSTNGKITIPSELKPIASHLRIAQKWDMFSPFPLKITGWYIVPALLFDGTKIDLMRNGAPLSWEKPEVVSHMYKHNRWRRYFMRIRKDKNLKYIKYYAGYLCRDWNSRHTKDKKLDKFKIYFMKQENLPNYKKGKVEKLLLWKHYCINAPDNSSNTDDFPF